MEKATNDAQKWFYPSGPIPERGRSTFFSISDDGKKLIYPGSHHVMIVDINVRNFFDTEAKINRIQLNHMLKPDMSVK